MLSSSLFYILVFHFAFSFYLLGATTLFNIHLYNLSREPEGIFIKRTLPLFMVVIGIPMAFLLITSIAMVIAKAPILFTYFAYLVLVLMVTIWILSGFVIPPLFRYMKSEVKKQKYVQVKSYNLLGLICWIIQCALIFAMLLFFLR